MAVPFSLVGAFWFLYLLGYNLSIAVWVGLIALAGLDAETGVVMLLYLDHAWDKYRVAGRMNSMDDLQVAVIEGAVQRIRPKIMTICAILFGLLPIMWSPTTQSGADVMKRIAAPMIGGVIASGILELLLYPVIYVFWRKRQLGTPLAQANGVAISGKSAPVEPGSEGVISKPVAEIKPHPRIVPWIIIALLLVLGVGGFFAWQKFGRSGSTQGTSQTPFMARKINNLTVDFISPKGQLQKGINDFEIEFRDSASGELVDVGTVKLDLNMNMPGMTMHSAATIAPTSTPGQYHAELKADIAGDWTATLRYEGPHGKGNTDFPTNVKP